MSAAIYFGWAIPGACAILIVGGLCVQALRHLRLVVARRHVQAFTHPAASALTSRDAAWLATHGIDPHGIRIVNRYRRPYDWSQEKQ